MKTYQPKIKIKNRFPKNYFLGHWNWTLDIEIMDINTLAERILKALEEQTAAQNRTAAALEIQAEIVKAYFGHVYSEVAKNEAITQEATQIAEAVKEQVEEKKKRGRKPKVVLTVEEDTPPETAPSEKKPAKPFKPEDDPAAIDPAKDPFNLTTPAPDEPSPTELAQSKAACQMVCNRYKAALQHKLTPGECREKVKEAISAFGWDGKITELPYDMHKNFLAFMNKKVEEANNGR